MQSSNFHTFQAFVLFGFLRVCVLRQPFESHQYFLEHHQSLLRGNQAPQWFWKDHFALGVGTRWHKFFSQSQRCDATLCLANPYFAAVIPSALAIRLGSPNRSPSPFPPGVQVESGDPALLHKLPCAWTDRPSALS